MKKKSDEIPAIFTVNLPEQVEAGKPTPVVVKVTQKPGVKEYWRDPKELQGAVKVERWCPPQCYAIAKTIFKLYGSTERYSAVTSLPSMDFRPEVLEMVDLLIQAFIGPEEKLLERAKNAEENRQNKLREKLLLTSPETPLPPPVLADDALIQMKHALAPALEPYFSKVDAMEAKLGSAESQLRAKDLQIEELHTKCRQLEQRITESDHHCEKLQNDLITYGDLMSKGLHDHEVLRTANEWFVRNKHQPEQRLFKFGTPSHNNVDPKPPFVGLKLVATYRSDAMELIRRYQTDPDLVRTKKAAND